MITIRYFVPASNNWVFMSFPSVEEAQKVLANYRKNKMVAEFVNW